MPYEPGTCPGCGADWSVGRHSQGRMGNPRRCGCRDALEAAGYHAVHGCQLCDAVVLVPPCSDPSLQRGRAFSYEVPGRP